MPTDDATKAVITVKTGGVRTGTNTVGNLEGVQLELVRDSAGDSQGSPTNTQIATCTSDEDGDCNFEVAAALLNSTANRQFWIRQLNSFEANSDAADNYFRNDSLVTGLNLANYQDTAYQFYISNVQPDNTYVSGVNFMQQTENSRQGSVGIWQNSYNNPPAQAKCGLNIALVSDLSSSVDATALAQLKQAATGFVQALAGTPSTISLFTFGTTAPSANTSGSNNTTLLGQSALVPANVTALTNKIAGYGVPGGNYTNWDAGLWQTRGQNFDQIIVITDGNPTAFSTNSTTDGVDTRFNEIERAIFSANALKAAGSRVITVGIGTTMLDGQNLKAISGPNEGSDFFSGDWDELANTLGGIATENCAGSVTVVKKVIPWNGTVANATAAADWVFDATADPAGVSLDQAQGTTDANGATNFQLSDVPVDGGATFSATEQVQGGYTLEQQGGKNAVCTKNGGTAVTVTNGAGTTFSVPVGYNDIVTCTVYNKEAAPGATLTVNKQWVINGTPQTLNTFPTGFEADLDGTATEWGQSVSTPAGEVTITEEDVKVPAEYCTLVSQEVTDLNGDPLEVDISEDPFTPSFEAGTDNTATITNSVTCGGLLELVKVVVNDNGGTATSADWTLKYGATGVASGTTVKVTPNVGYELTEVDGPEGYAPSAVDPLVCTSGLVGTTVTVPAMTTITCTFTNDDIAPTLQLVKEVVGAPAVNPNNWTLTAKDGATTAVSGAGETAVTPVDAGVEYTLAETAGPDITGSDFTASEWVCVDGATPVTVTAGVLDELELGQNVVCTITNTAKTSDPNITKSAEPAVQNQDGTWTIVYTVTVTNPSKYAGIEYDLTDTLDFGGSIAVASAGATLDGNAVPDWNGETVTDLATNKALAADSSDVYTITVVASVPDGETAVNCPTGPGAGGFLNNALLTVGDDEWPADACVAPSKPSFDKSAGTATDNGDGTYTVTYTLTVTNAEAAQLYYDLSDDPQSGFPTGVEVLSGTVTPGADYPGFVTSWNPVTATLNPVIVDGLALPGGSVGTPTVHSYTVSVVIEVATSVEASALDCTADDGGLVNEATLVSGNQVATDDACVSIPRPDVSHTKTLVSSNQNADGTWTVVYDIEVTATGSGTTTYDLSDVPDLGAGITLDSGSSTGPAQSAAWDGSGTTALATAEPIAAGETDSYTVTLIASVAADVTDTPAADCELGDQESGTGFLNVATLTVNGSTTDDDACASPALPSLVKDWISTVQNPDSSWDVTFEITVDNGGTDSDLYYDLSDIPGFFADATVTGRTVALNGAAATEWDGTSALANDRLLPGDTVDLDSKDTYLLVFTVTIPLDAENLECSVDGAGHGFFNSAELTSGSDTLTSDDCGPGEEGILPTITKVVKTGFPTQLAGGNWEIQYDVTVSTPESTTLSASYDLSDTLEFGDGIEVVSAEVTGPGLSVPNSWNGGSETSIATGVVLPGGDTHTYTVTVVARLDAGVVDTIAADCVVDGDETGTGFRNAAQLTSGGLERDAVACATPAAPELTKDIVGAPVPAGGGAYTITYTVTASNPSALGLNYTLDDALQFAQWVFIGSAKVESTDATVNPAWNGVGNTRVVTDQPLPAGASDVFTVTVVATPTLFVEPQNLACVAATPGKGYFNEAVLTTGNDTYRDDACAPIPLVELPTLPLDPPTLAFTGMVMTGSGIIGGIGLLVIGIVILFVRRVRSAA